ncbi:MAG: protein kinase [Acidobacteria bacterium]|nr:protein kinase [Acidobacteriota bacterium]
MALAPGSRLGPYEIVARIGAGGMGEVWRATDTRLGRQVALKLLPEGFADDPERHARFEREARVLASLNHPNIAHLYGLEHLETEASGRRPLHALVMELVDGEDLAERLARGPIEVDEAIPIARQVAEALEAAHEQGIVHRDVKPANVMVRPDGTVKVLDFGLAKAWQGEPPSPDLANSPTVTSAYTQAGVLLGSVSYMSPEQARGRAVDRRTDTWAFGAVLFEMLTGRKLFDGPTVPDILAAVLRAEPDLAALPAAVPAPVRDLVARCLVRDPRRRLQSIGEARIVLEDALASPPPGVAVGPGPTASPSRPAPTGRRGAVLGVLLPVAAVLGAALGWLIPRAHPVPAVVRSSLLPPPGTQFFLSSRQPGPVSLSPHGDRAVFAAQDGAGTVRLWVRALAASEAAALAGTEDGSYPFWSPDGRSIGFFAGGKLKRVAADGGPVFTLCDAPFGKGGTWNAAGDILFAPSYGTGLFRIPADGGQPAPVTVLDRARKENSHRFPRFLPDGHTFLYLARISGERSGTLNEVRAASIDGGEPHTLLGAATNAEFAAGHLFYVRDGVLLARCFDPGKLGFDGPETVLAAEVRTVAPAAAGVFSVADNGVLLHGHGTGGYSTSLVRVDRSGRVTRTVGDPAIYYDSALSPDGRRIAVAGETPVTGRTDVWIMDAERGVPARLTAGEAGGMSPVWLPSGKEIVFRARESRSLDLYVQDIDGPGTGARLLLQTEFDKIPTSVSPDGALLAFSSAAVETGHDIWMLPLAGNGAPYPFLVSRSDEENARFSPDGRWLAFESDESGRVDVYVTSFPTPRQRLRVSAGGGRSPRWSRDGRALYFLAGGDTLMRVEVGARGTGIELGPPAQVCRLPFPTMGAYDPWGVEFMFEAEQRSADEAPLTLVTSWPALIASSAAR